MKARIPLDEAEALADELTRALASSCSRLAVAGSIRRRKPDVGDIEVVVVPLVEQVPYGLFGDQTRPCNRFAERCVALRDAGELRMRRDQNNRTSWGDRYKRAYWQRFACDLFSVVEPAQFGVIFAIRTGPAEFSHRLVTSELHGGLMPPHLHVKGGALWHRDGEMIPTPEEEDLFRALGLAWIEPWERV